MESLQESQEINLQKLRTSELILNKAKQKMRELTINIRMKEDLIKELIKTGNSILSLCEKAEHQTACDAVTCTPAPSCPLRSLRSGVCEAGTHL